MHTNVSDLVRGAAATHPDAPALSYRDATLSYAELADRVRGCAQLLERCGIQRGDRVAVYLEKRFETVIGLFGSAEAGAAFVPVNPVLKPAQVAYILADSGARVLITTGARLRSLAAHLGDLPALQTIVVVDPDKSTDPTFVPWSDEPSEAPRGTPRGIDEDLAAILYTSGSTGAPKGVALSHRNLLAGAESVNAYLRNGPDDVILAVLPLSFDAGFSQLTTGFAAGAHVVLANYLLPRDIVRLCDAHGVTAMTCVPPLWIQLAEQEWGAAGERLRYFANTGGRMPRVTLDRLRSVFPHAAPYLMYGLTEAFRSTYLPPGEVDTRPDSIGKAIPNAEVLVLRPDGTPCGPDEPGELVHRGALVAMGYWEDAARTRERFRPIPSVGEGWSTDEVAVWSGDIVRSDAEGFLYFVGRNDDMIKTSGYRVSPSEIEEAALSTGLYRDAVALGLADDALGQRIILVVAGSRAEDASTQLMKTLRRDLPLFMVPGQIVERAELPRGANGKYDRVMIRGELESM